MSWAPPSVSDFKAFFLRDFNYAPAADQLNQDYILDADITKALNQSGAFFNTALNYGSDANQTLAFLYLAAFYLVWSIQNSMKGVASQFNFPVSSRSAGGVSISFSIPERFTKSPIFSQFTQNGYGMFFLSMLAPLIVGGGVKNVCGTTTVG